MLVNSSKIPLLLGVGDTWWVAVLTHRLWNTHWLMGSTATGVFTLEISHNEWLACPNHMGINCRAKWRVSVSWEGDFQLSTVGRTGNSDLSKDGGWGAGAVREVCKATCLPAAVCRLVLQKNRGWGTVTYCQCQEILSLCIHSANIPWAPTMCQILF